MTEDSAKATQRGGALTCGKCRTRASWDPVSEEYRCPDCGEVIA